MKTISIHSYRGGTGKTTFLLNLAGLMTEKRNKVLAIDYDLRAPSFQSYFSYSQGNFISDFLLEEKSLDQILIPTESRPKGKLDLIFSSMEFLKQHSKQRDKLSRDDAKYLSKLYELQKKVLTSYDSLLIDTTPGFFFRSIDAMMVSDSIITIVTPSTSNVLGLKELCNNIYDILKKDAKMVLVINKIGDQGIDADKAIVEKNLKDLKEIGHDFYEGNMIEVPYYGVMGERIHSFESEPNKQFLEKIKLLKNIL